MSAIYPTTMPGPAPEGSSRAPQAKGAPAILPLTPGEGVAAAIPEKTDSSRALINDYLRLFLADQEGLMEIFQNGREVFGAEAKMGLYPGTAADTMRNIARVIGALFFSPDSLQNTLFIKDYITNLGLLQEGTWRTILEQAGQGASQCPAENLKSLLMKLAETLQATMRENSALPREELQKLTELVKFTETAVRAIETQQVINVYAQENENKYLLQIPLLFPQSVRTGEIFIDLGKKGKGTEGQKKNCRVVMFLDMEHLGAVEVDASLNDNKIGCVFKFADPGTKDFFSSCLGGLGDALHRAGYELDFLTCLTVADMTAARQECHREMCCGERAINLFA